MSKQPQSLYKSGEIHPTKEHKKKLIDFLIQSIREAKEAKSSPNNGVTKIDDTHKFGQKNLGQYLGYLNQPMEGYKDDTGGKVTFSEFLDFDFLKTKETEHGFVYQYCVQFEQPNLFTPFFAGDELERILSEASISDSDLQDENLFNETLSRLVDKVSFEQITEIIFRDYEKSSERGFQECEKPITNAAKVDTAINKTHDALKYLFESKSGVDSIQRAAELEGEFEIDLNDLEFRSEVLKKACQEGRADIINICADYGADLNDPIDNKAPSEWAKDEKTKEVIKEIIENQERAKRANNVFQDALFNVFASTVAVDANKRAIMRDKIAQEVLPPAINEALEGARAQMDTTEFLNFALDSLMPRERRIVVESRKSRNSKAFSLTGEATSSKRVLETKLDLSFNPEKLSDSSLVNVSDLLDYFKDDASSGRTSTPKVSDPNAEIVISLKRNSNQEGNTQKIDNNVSLDDITLEVESVNPSSLIAVPSQKKYRATAFTRHLGDANGGHYVTYVLENDNKWYCYDDDKDRSEISGKDLEEAKANAYTIKYTPLESDGSLDLASLPASQKSGTANVGNQCWANAATVFLMSMTSLRDKTRTRGDTNFDAEHNTNVAPPAPNYQQEFSIYDIFVWAISDKQSDLNLVGKIWSSLNPRRQNELLGKLHEINLEISDKIRKIIGLDPLPQARSASSSAAPRDKIFYLPAKPNKKHIGPNAVFDLIKQEFTNVETTTREREKKVIVLDSGAFYGAKELDKMVGEIRQLIADGFRVFGRDGDEDLLQELKDDRQLEGIIIESTRQSNSVTGPFKDIFEEVAVTHQIPKDGVLVLSQLSLEEKRKAFPSCFDQQIDLRPPFIGWKPSPTLSTNLVSEVKDLIGSKLYDDVINEHGQLASILSSADKNVLIKVGGNSLDVDAHANYLIRTEVNKVGNREASRPVFCLDGFSQVHSGAGNISLNTQKNSYEFTQDSPLITFLKEHKDSDPAPLIIIDWTRFDAKQRVMLNSLLDQQRKIGDVEISEGAKIVSLCYATDRDTSFSSRHSASKLSNLTEADVYRSGVLTNPISNKDISGETERYFVRGGDWRNYFATPYISKSDAGDDKLSFRQGIVGILNSSKPTKVIGLTNDQREDFSRSFKRAGAFKKFNQYGHEYPIKDDLVLQYSENYDFALITKASERLTVTKNALRDNDGDRHVINSQLFGSLVRKAEVENGKYKEIDDLLTAAKKHAKIPGKENDPLKLYISSALTDAQWSHLLRAAFATSSNDQALVNLDLHLAPGVELPKGVSYAKSQDLTISEVVSSDKEAFKPNAKIIVAKNANVAAAEVKKDNATSPDYVIDVTDLTYQDLFGGYDFDKGANRIPQNLRKKEGLFAKLPSDKTLVLKGVFSEELLQMMEQEIGNLPANITLVIEHPDPENFRQSALRWLKPEYCKINDSSPTRSVQPITTIENFGDWDSLEDSKKNSEAFIAQRKKNLADLLVENSMVQLIGHTGTGKSSLINEYEKDESQNAVVYRGLSDLKKWAESTEAGKTKILFIDESNIEDSHLTVFDPLKKDGNRKIFYQGEFIELTDQHKVVFASNPKEYGGSRMHQRLFEDGSIPAQQLHGFPACYIYEKLIKEAIPQADPEVCKKLIAEFRQNQNSKLILDQNKPTVRELQQRVLSSMVLENFKPDEEIRSENFVSTDATKLIEQKLSLEIEVKKLQRQKDSKIRPGIGLNGFLLEGDSGTGKSEMIKAMLAHKGIEEGKVQGSYTDDKQRFYKIDASLPREQKSKIIAKAFEEGNIVWIDEINSCLDDGLEKELNLALTGEHPQEKKGVVPKPGFMMISSVNSISMDGRSDISPALRHRSINLRTRPLETYSAQDFVKIAQNWLSDKQTQKQAIDAMQQELNGFGEDQFFSPIDRTCFYQRAINDKVKDLLDGDFKDSTEEEIRKRITDLKMVNRPSRSFSINSEDHPVLLANLSDDEPDHSLYGIDHNLEKHIATLDKNGLTELYVIRNPDLSKSCEDQARKYLNQAKEEFNKKHRANSILDNELFKKLTDAIGYEMFSLSHPSGDEFGRRPPFVNNLRTFKSLLTEIAGKNYAVCYEHDYGVDLGTRRESLEPIPTGTPPLPPSPPPAPPSSKPTPKPRDLGDVKFLKKVGQSMFDVNLAENDHLKITESKVEITARVMKGPSSFEHRPVIEKNKDGKEVEKTKVVKFDTTSNLIFDKVYVDGGKGVAAVLKISSEKFQKEAMEYYHGKTTKDAKGVSSDLSEEQLKEKKTNLAQALNVGLAAVPRTACTPTKAEKLAMFRAHIPSRTE